MKGWLGLVSKVMYSRPSVTICEKSGISMTLAVAGTVNVPAEVSMVNVALLRPAVLVEK